MISTRQFITCSGIILFVLSGIAATRLPHSTARNLQILPNDISDEKLDSIMHTYNKALNVNCAFCHAPSKVLMNALDFASDEKSMKEEARKMMEKANRPPSAPITGK